ncbi:MAG: hypothetical protein GY936_15855 [Ignavibacteriae bacterium]|nr:hypothetical protein [Ignavibacteriota bacterium]
MGKSPKRKQIYHENASSNGFNINRDGFISHVYVKIKNKMKLIKKLHKRTELHIKIGLPIVVLIIVPAVLELLQNVSTIANRL